MSPVLDASTKERRDFLSIIDWEQRPARSLICPICGAEGAKAFVLAVESSIIADSSLELFECPACDSKFFPDLRPPAYDKIKNPDIYLDFYLEIGAGIDQLLRHLFAVPLPPNARYLEIGCGFGFALDFARRAFGLRVQGIDPSPFATAGAHFFGLPIIDGYLTAETELQHACFDIAVASEVLEHIFNPVAFLQAIVTRLGPNGVLIMTTPDAAKAKPDTTIGALVPLLSAGWHYILYSSASLEWVLRKAGFARVVITAREHSLVAAATNGDLPINLDAELDRNMFGVYLEEVRDIAECIPALSRGLGYRLLRELTNAEQHGRALALFEEMRLQFSDAYGFDIESPHANWLYINPEESLETFAARYPMCLCGIAHLRGIIALNADAEPSRAAHFFSLSFHHGDLLRQALAAFGVDDGETEVLTERSRALYLRALAYRDPVAAASEAMRLIARSRKRPQCYSGQHEDLIAIIPHLINLGALEAAESLIHEAECSLALDTTSWLLRFDLRQALGLLELNGRRRPMRAALHFARAERAARRLAAGDPRTSISNCIWRACHARFIAWLVAGRPDRARNVARRFNPIQMRQILSPNEIAMAFVHVVNLAELTIAERFSPYMEQWLKERCEQAASTDNLRGDVHNALGILEINQASGARRAALHFALAERCARRIYRLEPTPEIYAKIWRARSDRLLAWMVAENAQRARLISWPFQQAAVLESIPTVMRDRTRTLIMRAHELSPGAR